MNAQTGVRRAAAPLLLLAITVFGAWLRFHASGQKGLWLDEAFSVWLGWQRLPEMWGWVARLDQHPPLYYTLLNLWMQLGDDATTVRSLSAVFGALTIPFVFLFGRRLAGQTVGLLAGLILALSPFHVRFAQEARMYALLAFAATVALTCLAYLMRGSSPDVIAGSATKHSLGCGEREIASGQKAALAMTCHRQVLAWMGYVVFTAAAMLTHSAALLLPVSTNLFVLGWIIKEWRARPAGPRPGEQGEKPSSTSQSQERCDLAPPQMRSWLLAQAGVLALWGAIWLPAFVGQAGGVYRAFWLPAPTWRTLVDAVGNFLTAHLPRQQMPWLDAIWVLYVILLALGIAALRRRPAALALLLILFLTPLVGELLISLRRPVFYDRTLIWVTIPLYVLLAAGVSALRRWQFILVASVILCAANAVALREYYVNFQKEGWNQASAYVAQQAREGDVILFNASWTQIPFDYYYRETGMPLPEHGLPVDLFDRGVLEPPMTPADLPRLDELIWGRQRVWLVYSHNWYTDPQGLIPEALSRELTRKESRLYHGIELSLYEGSHDP